MDYRLDKQTLLDVLGQWNRFFRRKIHLIACGGTALTLMDVKASTKDVDFMVPNEPEYRYLIRTLKDLDYRQKTGSGWQKKRAIYI
jgi:pantothenate kinase